MKSRKRQVDLERRRKVLIPSCGWVYLRALYNWLADSSFWVRILSTQKQPVLRLQTPRWASFRAGKCMNAKTYLNHSSFRVVSQFEWQREIQMFLCFQTEMLHLFTYVSGRNARKKMNKKLWRFWMRWLLTSSVEGVRKFKVEGRDGRWLINTLKYRTFCNLTEQLFSLTHRKCILLSKRPSSYHSLDRIMTDVRKMFDFLYAL